MCRRERALRQPSSRKQRPFLPDVLRRGHGPPPAAFRCSLVPRRNLRRHPGASVSPGSRRRTPATAFVAAVGIYPDIVGRPRGSPHSTYIDNIRNRIPGLCRGRLQDCDHQKNKKPGDFRPRAFLKLPSSFLNLHEYDEQSEQQKRFDKYKSKNHGRPNGARRSRIPRHAFAGR